jgi:hypothetical protein
VLKFENVLTQSYAISYLAVSESKQWNLPGRSAVSWQRSVLIALPRSQMISCTIQTCFSYDPGHRVAGIHCNCNIQENTHFSTNTIYKYREDDVYLQLTCFILLNHHFSNCGTSNPSGTIRFRFLRTHWKWLSASIFIPNRLGTSLYDRYTGDHRSFNLYEG